MDKAGLLRSSMVGFLSLVMAMALFIFMPAWTVRFWQGWVFLVVFSVSALWITVYLYQQDPQLLERRVNAGPIAEKALTQKVIQIFASLAFMATMVVPGLDHHFGWSHLSSYVVLVGDGLVAIGFLIVFRVFKENTFTSATIEVAPGQRVIATGPYSIERHPMYLGGIVLMLGVPFALGSIWGLLPFVAIAIAIVWRLLDEEKFLQENLPGYREYGRKTRYRLIPFVW
jgi:protein-S-isoprenylcysteine O-methyltransferase Ste14